MTRFEYAAIFNGIFVALALENIAASFHKLIDAGRRVRWHWMAPTNAIGSAIATIGQFWVWWRGRDIVAVNPTVFSVLLNAATLFLLYLACAATLPDDVPESGIDLKAFYFSKRQQYWSIVEVTVLLATCNQAWFLVFHNFEPQLVQLNGPMVYGGLAIAAIVASLIVVKAPWWHTLAIITITSGVILQYGPLKL